MLVKVLSSKEYDNTSENCGDCIIIDNGSELVVYDCGCETHAQRVIEYMDFKGYEKATIILSHNDSDHFNGVTYLIDNNRVSKLLTVLLLKYKDELLERIDDDRKTRNSIGNQILELYSNIASLSEKVELVNIYDEDGSVISVSEGIEIVGPDEEYMLDAVSKELDTREGDTIDGETVVNATSVQVKVKLGRSNILLTGDASFAAIEGILDSYSTIQLPHHGKQKQAELIFEAKFGQNDIIYVVSDNTGDSNGGSDNLNTKGRIVKNTKYDGDIVLKEEVLRSIGKPTGAYWRYDAWGIY